MANLVCLPEPALPFAFAQGAAGFRNTVGKWCLPIGESGGGGGALLLDKFVAGVFCLLADGNELNHPLPSVVRRLSSVICRPSSDF